MCPSKSGLQDITTRCGRHLGARAVRAFWNTSLATAAPLMTESAAPSWIPEMLVEILSVVAAGFESGGISGAAFAIPPATLAAMGRVPGLVFNLNAVAFAFSVGLFLLTTPILVVTALQCITSLSAVGPVRKTLSFLLVLLLWWAVPLLATILLGLLWTALGILVICFIILLPLILNFVFLYYFLPAAHEFRQANPNRSP